MHNSVKEAKASADSPKDSTRFFLNLTTGRLSQFCYFIPIGPEHVFGPDVAPSRNENE